jgi:hypothetical protein
MTESSLEADAAPNNVIRFPGVVRRGRKRAIQKVQASGGDLALMMLSRDGEPTPENIERFQLAKDRKNPTIDKWCQLYCRWDEAHLLAIALYLAVPAEAQSRVQRHLRHAAFDGHDAPDMRFAADKLLSRLPAPNP